MAPLNENQKELLSAFTDAEVTDDERVEALALLERDDAQAYLSELQSAADLVNKHAPVRAPVGLRGRVMNALESEFKSKPPGADKTPVQSFSWRTPMYAAAAAIIVSLTIMFGPGLLSPGDKTGATVAREALENLPAEPEASGADVEGSRLQDSPQPDAYSRDASNLRPEDRALKKDKSADGGESKRLEEIKDKARAGAESDGDWRKKEGAKSNEEGEPAPGATGQGSAPGRDGGNPAPKEDDENARKGGEFVKRARGGSDRDEATPPPAPESTEGERNADAPAEEGPPPVTVSIAGGKGLAAQTDVLWVATLYGQTEIEETDDGAAYITVEVAATRMDAMLNALQKLAADQGYGELEGKPESGDEPELALADADAEQAHISGYLPADAPQNQAGETKTIRVNIYLK